MAIGSVPGRGCRRYIQGSKDLVATFATLSDPCLRRPENGAISEIRPLLDPLRCPLDAPRRTMEAGQYATPQGHPA